MSRPSKGARLVWRKESRKADGSLRSKAGWFIEDGGKRSSTGFGRDDRHEAEKCLAAYIATKHTPARQRDRDPAQVKIADVVTVYLEEVAPKHSRPKETADRMLAVLRFFDGKTLAHINGKVCRDYAAQAKSPSAARRQLEDLRAAIKHYHAEGYVTMVPAIVLPEKPECPFQKGVSDFSGL